MDNDVYDDHNGFDKGGSAIDWRGHKIKPTRTCLFRGVTHKLPARFFRDPQGL